MISKGRRERERLGGNESEISCRWKEEDLKRKCSSGNQIISGRRGEEKERVEGVQFV